MGFLFGLIGGKTKLYILIGLAVVAGLFGWRRSGINSALEREENKHLQNRLNAMQTKKEMNWAAETQDDTSLIERLTKKDK